MSRTEASEGLSKGANRVKKDKPQCLGGNSMKFLTVFVTMVLDDM
jgi:hypothetical protein